MPNDVDVVSIHESAEWSHLEPSQRVIAEESLRHDKAMDEFECDSYHVVRYPPHLAGPYERSVKALQYWDETFSHTRPYADGSRRRRGYVEVHR